MHITFLAATPRTGCEKTAPRHQSIKNLKRQQMIVGSVLSNFTCSNFMAKTCSFHLQDTPSQWSVLDLSVNGKDQHSSWSLESISEQWNKRGHIIKRYVRGSSSVYPLIVHWAATLPVAFKESIMSPSISHSIYTIHEAHRIGKEANIITLYLHDYLPKDHNLDETDLHFQTDNCAGQNKNNQIIMYLLCRCFTNRLTSIKLSF